MSIQNFQQGQWLQQDSSEAATLKLSNPYPDQCAERARIALVQRIWHLIRGATETGLVTTF